jgi:hypothetical protein
VPTYLYCNQAILSNISIPELQQLDTSEKDIIFRVESNQVYPKEHSWLHNWVTAAHEISLSYCVEDTYHWLRFPSLADFRISTDAGEIVCYPFLETPLRTIHHLLLDQVLPRYLAHQGMLMIHASAVQVDKGLVLFIGDSGSGKSTMAGIFHQSGDQAVSDDCVWVDNRKDKIVGVPCYEGLRLWEDSLHYLFSSEANTHSVAHNSTKRRVSFNHKTLIKAQAGIPVLAAIVLSPSVSDVILERLTHRDAFIAILRQAFQLNVMDMGRMTRHVQLLGSIIPKLPSFRLSSPRDYDLLPILRNRILEAIR